jgi:imidazoleglycerol-phosphate dehydratase
MFNVPGFSLHHEIEVMEQAMPAYAVLEAGFETSRIGQVSTDLLVHFLETLAFTARMSLHGQVLHGRNDHHRAEALFKALGRALDAATREDPRRTSVPSTKGVL